MQRRFLSWPSCLIVGVIGCGPRPAPAALPPAISAAPEPPSPPPPASGSDAPASEQTESTPPAAEPAAEKKAEPEPEAEMVEKPSRPPLEIITAADTAFLVNYPNSAASEAAHKTCSEKNGADDEAIAKCLSDARAAFKADVIRFKKNGQHFVVTFYKRDGSRLDETCSARVALREESPSSVKLTFTGNEKGLRPLLKGKREALLGVPNDYSVVITDTDLGKLVYEAKIGLVAN